MSKPVLSLEQLRELLKKPDPKNHLAHPILEPGIPLGSITQIAGLGKTEFIASLLVHHPDRRAVWVQTEFSLFPTAFFQRGIASDQLLFVAAGKEVEWAVLNALKSQAFSMVVFEEESHDPLFLKRVQLATERSQAAAIHLVEAIQSSWTHALQLRVRREQSFLKVDVLRRRTG